MGTRGKWGITRDEDGSLANIYDWPWYWRYTAGLAVLLAAVTIATMVAGSASEWRFWLVAGFGVLFALLIMGELGGFLLLAALAGGIWFAMDALIPDVELSLPVRIGGAGTLVVGFLWHQAMEKFRTQQKAIDNTWKRLTNVEEARTDQSADIYLRLASLDAKLAELEALQRKNSRQTL
ncbi:hypothetical protein [Lysobacter sp. A3-1-A15]|uniref:hypothetical protein n=1 Tax=Novilysobacter viscosus TaxID=3098602 RepID=UPI002ED7DCBD